ncbi:SDR family NAD(P)-dependent oxidoreductase [Aureliella helgolandensis]|uniref:2-dehydro-3-deoxy-D-gluconate 5-dehydrogenase n=1 Tax=Aureliella helgolandensis TaxID=2527968 RepID=A0A518GHC8_9BACT|nr:SDR family oxidoreductase [Aureliella helgolandensis]QDV27968.1 2-dehydro-3-deoxy-D-gluconate 5-dehydrogenase [Aureliella helgolandensis]
MSTTKSLQGKVAIVTGAARGIGAAAAIELARAGAHVVVNDILPPDDTLKKITMVGGTGSAGVADVTDRAAVDQLVQSTKDTHGRIDLLVTNAAYSDRELFYKADLDGFQKTIDVCLWGPFNFVRAVANVMIEQGTGGAMVCISSPHAFKAIPGAMAYNMAKAATDQMARTAACELAEHRIRVNIVHPGWTDTPGERKFFHETELNARGSELPWGRLAKPEEIARGVLFLCEPGSEYINGATLPIDGGALLPHEQMFRVSGRPG